MSANSIIFRSSIINKIVALLLCIITAFLLPRLITSYGLVIVVGGAILIPLIVIFFIRPKIGLLVFIATDFLLGFVVSSSLSTQSFMVTGVRFIGLIVLAGWIAQIVLKCEKPRFVHAPQNVILLLYFLASVASTFFSKYPINGLLDLQTLGLQIILYFLVMSMVNSPKMIEKIVWTIVLVGVVSIIVAIYQLIFLPVVRLGGTIINANGFALVNIIFLSLTLFQIYNLKSAHSKALLGIVAAFLVFCIIASGSRAGLITLGFITMLFLIAYRSKEILRNIFTLSAVGVVLLLILNNFEIPVISRLRILDIPSPLSFFMDPMNIKEGSARARALQLQVAREIFLYHPILGLGPRAYIMEEYQYITRRYNPVYDYGTSPHNIYIALLTEHGILGTLLFLCLIWLTLRDFRRAGLAFKKQGNLMLLNWTQGIELSYIGFLFFGLSSATGLSNKYLFIVIALAPVLRKLATQKRIYEAK